MAALRRAVRTAWLGKRYSVIEPTQPEGKENHGFEGTPAVKRSKDCHERKQDMERPTLRRNTSVTQSVRDVVGTFRQKLKKSTKQRKRLQEGSTPAKKKKGENITPTRRGGFREVKLYSPFGFDTPPNRRGNGMRTRPTLWHGIETPSKLRKEVEDLTSNMQALVTLTPNTLQTRAMSRRSLGGTRSTPLTNGSLNTPRSNRKVKVTQIRRNIQHTVL